MSNDFDPNAIRITFLGTSSGAPTRFRNVSGIALQFPQRPELWLLDCGEGTQHQILRQSHLNPSHLRRIFITHMHGDHIYGLPGLLCSFGMTGILDQVDIYGPPGLEDYIKMVLAYSESHLSFSLNVHTVETGLICQDSEYSVFCAPLKHRIPAFGYRIVEHDRPGIFQVDRAKADGIPPGRIYGRLKAGEQVTLEDGRVVDGKDYVGSPILGRKLAYCTDTMYCSNSVDLARAADLVIHEATFAEAELSLAERSRHSTAMMAAKVALEAKAHTLMLTHFSARYNLEGELSIETLLKEAGSLFPQVLAARDRLVYEIPRRVSE